MERAALSELATSTGCARESGGIVFLLPPDRSPDAQAAFLRLLALPDRRPGTETTGWLCLPTGGSSGGLKFARHDETTLQAAVSGLQQHLGLERINTVDVLPPHHVSGFMARVRSAATGGTHLAWDWKQLEAGDCPDLPPRPDGWVLSLVPTQLQRLLAQPAARDWLGRFRHLFLGGGPTWLALAQTATDARLPISLTYGMTETAAMVTAQRPGDFLAGDRTSGPALPHVVLRLDEEGVIRISGRSVFRGYWPEWSNGREFVTADLGRLDSDLRLTVLGRRDAAVITGGEKVHPAEVELALRDSGEFDEVAVVGLPDPEWGEILVACYPRSGRPPGDLRRAVARLAPHQRPKHFVPVEPWPALGAGKIDRASLLIGLRADPPPGISPPATSGA